MASVGALSEGGARPLARAGTPPQVIGWLLLLPAMVLLVAFTHWPALATAWHSLFTTPKGARSS